MVASALGKRTRYALATIGGAFCLAWGEPGAASVTFEYAGTVAAVAALDTLGEDPFLMAQLVTAETNAVQAIFNYYVADARLKRAIADNDPYPGGYKQ